MSVVYCPYCYEALGVGEMAEDVLEMHERCREMWQHDERLAKTMSGEKADKIEKPNFSNRETPKP